MATDTLIFPLWRIALTAAIAFVVSLIVLRWRYKEFTARDASLISIVVGISVLLWRSAGNVALLNDDPIPFISPNDVLCPTVTWVLLSMYGALRRVTDLHWEQARALLTLVSFIINVITI